MAHYAFLDENNIVTEVIPGRDENDLDNLPNVFSSWEEWYADYRNQTCKRTSYNTKNNQHQLDGTPFRGNFAGIGYTYDEINDVFYAPQPYPSWVLNETTWTWEAPIPYPSDNNFYLWNEETTSWELPTP